MSNKQQLSPNRKGMRKALILLMTLALVVTSIGAAAAKGKPDKPSSAPVYYDVTMDLVGDSNGLSTRKDECTSGGTLVMRLEESRSGSLLATADGSFPSDPDTSDPDLYLRAGFAEPVDGCWYGTNSPSTISNADFFRMVFDRDGALEKITWHFDVVMDGATVTHKYTLTSQTKKGRNAVGVEWAGNLADSSTTGIVTGIFEMSDYTNTDGPVWTSKGTRDFAFMLTIAPRS